MNHDARTSLERFELEAGSVQDPTSKLSRTTSKPKCTHENAFAEDMEMFYGQMYCPDCGAVWDPSADETPPDHGEQTNE